MNAWAKLRDSFSRNKEGGYSAQASLDLGILEAHDAASKHLVAIDFSRLERRNKDRHASRRQAFGDLHVNAGVLRWTPQRLERSCGVPVVQFTREELRTIDHRPGAIVAVLKDGTNIPFVVPTQGSPKARRAFVRPRATGQEPPLIS